MTGIAAAHGLTVTLEETFGYPVTVNADAAAEFVAATASDLYGAERFHWMPHPIAAAEDFSFVLREVPGAILHLGACPPGRDPRTAPNNHAPDAVFDDAVLTDGAALLAELARRRLATAT